MRNPWFCAVAPPLKPAPCVLSATTAMHFGALHTAQPLPCARPGLTGLKLLWNGLRA